MLTDIREFMRQPLKRDMDALDWTLYVGLILVIIMLWTTLLTRMNKYIKGA